MRKAHEFIQGDLTLETAVEYLRTGSERSDEKVEESARKLIVDKFSEATCSGELVDLPTELFQSSIVCSTDFP